MTKYFSALFCMCLLLAGCGSDNESDQAANTPVQPAVTLDDLLAADAGIYGLYYMDNGLAVYARFKDNAHLRKYTSDSATSVPVVPSPPLTPAVLNEDGIWESRSISWQTRGFDRAEDGSYTRETWFGAQLSVELGPLQDLAGKPIADHVPLAAMLKSGAGIKDGAVFGPGSTAITLTGITKKETYALTSPLGPVSSLAAWMDILDRGTWLGSTSVHVDIERSSADAVEGRYTWYDFTPHTGSGTWKKVVIGSAEMIVFEGGSWQKPIFWQNKSGGTPMYSIKDGTLHEGIHVAAGLDLFANVEGDWSWMDYDKAAMASIEANLEVRTLFAYGTPTSAAELLEEGINYVYSDTVDFDDNFVTALLADRHLLEDSLFKYNNRFMLDIATKKFIFNDGLLFSGIETSTWLTSAGVWKTAAVYPSASVDAAGALVQTENSGNGGEISTTYNTIDIAGLPVVRIMAANYNNLDSSFYDRARLFRPGAKFISHQSVQKTTGYQLWTLYATGHSSLAALVDGGSVSAWTGKSVNLVFPDISGTPGSGTLRVESANGSTIYGTANWTMKNVHGVDILVVSDIPKAGMAGEYSDNLYRPIFAVKDGDIYPGVEVLPGHIISTSAGVVLNKIAVEDLEQAIVP